MLAAGSYAPKRNRRLCVFSTNFLSRKGSHEIRPISLPFVFVTKAPFYIGIADIPPIRMSLCLKPALKPEPMDPADNTPLLSIGSKFNHFGHFRILYPLLGKLAKSLSCLLRMKSHFCRPDFRRHHYIAPTDGKTQRQLAPYAPHRQCPVHPPYRPPVLHANASFPQ